MYHYQDSEVMTSSSISSHTLSSEKLLKPRPRATDWQTDIRDKAGSVYETKIYDAKTAQRTDKSYFLLIDQSKQGLCFELSLGISSVCVYLSIMDTCLYRFTWNFGSTLGTKAKRRKYKGILSASYFKMVGVFGSIFAGTFKLVQTPWLFVVKCWLFRYICIKTQ